MEGENKDMKMKKLTALALAGVLCLGMSTTAFAAGSVTVDNAEIVGTDEWGEEVKENAPIKVSGVSDPYVNQKIDEWTDTEDEDKAYEQLVTDVTTWAEESDITIDKDAPMYYLGAADYTCDVKLSGDQKYVIDFDVNNIPNFDKMLQKVGPDGKVYLLHYVTTKDEYGRETSNMVMIEGKFETVNGVRVVRAELDSLSPIAFVLASGKATTNPGGPNEPGTDNKPGTDEPTIDKPTTGTLTADQLADLIVKKLQSQNVKVVRTVASGTVSPKTGE